MYRITLFIFTMILLLNPLNSIAAGKKIIQESKPRRSIQFRNEEKGRVLRTPLFSSKPITKATAGVLYTYTVTATDVDASAKLHFAAQTVPAWLKFNPATRSLSGIPSNEDIGEHPVVLTVSDGIAVPVKQAFTIRVARFNPDDGLILKVFANPKHTTLWVSVKDLQRDNYTVVERIKDSERRIPASSVTCKPARTADIPMISSLLRDLSSSLGDNEILQINAAFQTYIERMPPHEMAQIIDFSDQVTVRQPFTSSRQALKNALSFPQSRGSTAFFDAIIKALLSLDEAPQEALKLVLAFTDGEDNTSTHSLNDVLTMAKAKEIPIFCVGMGDAQEAVLRQIALSTHGLYFDSPSPETLVLVYDGIANLLDGTDILSYPTQARLGDEVSATIEYAGGRKTLTHPFVIGQDKNKQ